MIFWLVLKLEIRYRVMIYVEGIWFLFRGIVFLKIIFLHGEIFENCLKIHLPPHHSSAFQRYQECGWWVLPWFGRSNLLYMTNKPPSLINKHIHMHNTFSASHAFKTRTSSKLHLTSSYLHVIILLLVDS
jgi:hypothetical protein